MRPIISLARIMGSTVLPHTTNSFTTITGSFLTADSFLGELIPVKETPRSKRVMNSFIAKMNLTPLFLTQGEKTVFDRENLEPSLIITRSACWEKVR